MRLLKAMQEGERFSSTEETIVEYILSHPAQIAEMTTRELAEKTYTSPAAIFRLCQKLGLKGYNEFKIKFTSEINRTLPCGAHIMRRPITDKDSTSDIVRKLAQLEIEAIEETKNEMDLTQMERIAELLDKADIIDIYAYDQNFSLAQMAVYNFLQVKKTAVAHNSLNSQLSAALIADKHHLAIIISRSGLNQRLIRTARILKKQGIKTILLSVNRETKLACLCDEFLYVANTLDYLDLGGNIFSVGVRYYFDVLVSLLLSRHFTEVESFYKEFENYLGHADDDDRLW
ncbi:MAG: MurR/RpiR family transcriptional regulator [Selenomonas sp.]|uniref:MurR/RpiR family transcriptional regulator n=1 Tax=Selenomonas ruminantium TaxID=971 RepID=UPI001B23C09E|nr:MurR/RpiR family transcriptional regulator [Selenomonas ruminantium]MBO5650471.1 MurR/RpiR family transcriptional regulator [Selenomonas sp.]